PTAIPGNPSGQRPSIRLVVNADDFGLSTRINEGILLAHRAGIVTATSLMAVGRAFEQAVQCCRTVPALDVGVHLTLVAERPLLPHRSSLTGDDGRFPASAGAFLQHWLTGSIRRADVQAEWSAQIERVLDHGIRVTHLDSHQHVHILPGLADLSLRLAARYNIPFVRVPVEELRGDRWPSLHVIKRMFGATVLRAFWTLARLTGAKDAKYRPLRFLGFQDGGRLDDLRLRRLLRALRPGRAYELMCHPGLTPDEPDVQRWQYGHEKELQALTSPSIRSEIAARGIQLCNFKDLMTS
ncbi:MAG: ChbG/HpnK family deacetylase, partial [Desulfobacterales bacterium]|nr:ChbG/HpnK family deacetylase [Desulfobacterales bacterium]